MLGIADQEHVLKKPRPTGEKPGDVRASQKAVRALGEGAPRTGRVATEKTAQAQGEENPLPEAQAGLVGGVTLVVTVARTADPTAGRAATTTAPSRTNDQSQGVRIGAEHRLDAAAR